MNLILVTSVVNPPANPLSYSNCRSVYTSDERFTQTKKTISSIREKIPNSVIFLLECSKLTLEQENYFTTSCDYFINIYNTSQELINIIYGKSKALAEGTMTIKAIEYIKEHMQLGVGDNIFKISGRYYLDEYFNLDEYNPNSCNIFKKIDGNCNNICTALFKITGDTLEHLYIFLKSKNVMNQMVNCIGYEILFGQFVNNMLDSKKVKYLDRLGLSGNVTIDGSRYNG